MKTCRSGRHTYEPVSNQGCPECRSEYYREYERRLGRRKIDRMRAWAEANPEKAAEIKRRGSRSASARKKARNAAKRADRLRGVPQGMTLCRRGLHVYEPKPRKGCPECNRASDRTRWAAKREAWRVSHQRSRKRLTGEELRSNREMLRRRIKNRVRARKYGVLHANYDPRPVLEKQGWRCHYCLAPLTQTDKYLDHKQSLSRGGPDTLDNVCWCCRRCSEMKWARDEMEFLIAVEAGLLEAVERMSLRQAWDHANAVVAATPGAIALRAALRKRGYAPTRPSPSPGPHTTQMEAR